MNDLDPPIGLPASQKPETICAEQYRFAHHSLDLSRQQIRLLRIEDGEYGSSVLIKCEIQHFDFETHPPYRALSYTWGDPEPTREITLNGLRFRIRENLWHFLDIARASSQCAWIWIDAICIDQDNLGERNHQVQLMKDIFSDAEHVLSWLGPVADDSDKLIELIGTGRNSTYSAMHDLELQQTLGDEIAESDWLLEKNRDTQRFLQIFIEYQSAIDALLLRPYWQRIWIVQEVRHAYAVLNPPMHLTEFSLGNVVSTYRHSLCTDVRDRVYGVMSLVNERAVISIDYGRSTSELYFITLGKIIQTEWGHETKATEKYTDDLRVALRLGADIIDTTFVRLFVQCGIKYRPRLLTLEKWLEIVEKRERKAAPRG